MENNFLSIISSLKEKISPEEFKIWFNDLNFLKIDDNILFLKTANFFKKQKLISNYFSIIKNSVLEILPEIRNIEITVSDEKVDIKDNNSSSLKVISSKTTTVATNSQNNEIVYNGLKEQYNFDNFVVGSFNKLIYQFSKKIMSKFGAISPFYIYGGVGTGKTHTIQAIGNYFKENFPFYKIKYVNPNDFVSEFATSLKNKTDRQFRLKYKQLDCLIIDDIQFFVGKEKSTIEFFHIFNEIYTPGKQMIFAGDRSPAELGDIDERIKSRLSSSVVIELEPPDFDDRKKILKYYLQKNEIELDNKIINFLAGNIPGDIRKIIGAVVTLSGLKDIYHESITEDYCKKYIRQLVANKEISNIPPERIIISVAGYAKISVNEFKSSKRNRTLSHYRHLMMYLLKKYGNLSYTEIGNYLGGKTAGAVHNGYHTIEKGLLNDSVLNQTVDTILQNC